MLREPLARSPAGGIELSHALRRRGAGQLGDEGPNDARRLAGSWRSGWVTRSLGPERKSVSTGSVTGTGHPKGPLRLILARGPSPFPGCAVPSVGVGSAGLRPVQLLEPVDENPAQLWESRGDLWMTGGRSVDERAGFGGTRRMFRKALARPRRKGIELSHALPQGSAGQLGDEGPYGVITSLLEVGPRWLGDEAAGTRRRRAVDRERHQYRSPEGPLELILSRALHLFRLRPRCGPRTRRVSGVQATECGGGSVAGTPPAGAGPGPRPRAGYWR